MIRKSCTLIMKYKSGIHNICKQDRQDDRYYIRRHQNNAKLSHNIKAYQIYQRCTTTPENITDHIIFI